MANARSPAAQRRGRSRRERARRPTLLCIDDDPDAIEAISIALRRYDVRILRHFTGEQGFWEALCAKPDLIITDLKMPQGTGEMLLECLQRNPRTRGIPTIVVTGLRRADLPGHVKHLGAAQCLRKPVSIAELIAEIRRFVPLRQRDARDDGTKETLCT